MRQSNYILTFLLLAAAQMIICNYFHFSQYVTLSILPALILTIPTRINTPLSILIAFCTGLMVDLLAEGVTGLNALALVPVGFMRLGLCQIVFGEELIVRKDDFSIRKYGIAKVATAVTISQIAFLVVYIAADGAGTRSILFNLSRLGASLLSGVLVSLPVVKLLTPDTRK